MKSMTQVQILDDVVWVSRHVMVFKKTCSSVLTGNGKKSRDSSILVNQ